MWCVIDWECNVLDANVLKALLKVKYTMINSLIGIEATPIKYIGIRPEMIVRAISCAFIDILGEIYYFLHV